MTRVTPKLQVYWDGIWEIMAREAEEQSMGMGVSDLPIPTLQKKRYWWSAPEKSINMEGEILNLDNHLFSKSCL